MNVGMEMMGEVNGHVVIVHNYTCGCRLHEGDPRSTHPSGDYWDVVCGPHHRGEDVPCERIPDSVDAFVDRTLGDFIAAHMGIR